MAPPRRRRRHHLPLAAASLLAAALLALCACSAGGEGSAGAGDAAGAPECSLARYWQLAERYYGTRVLSQEHLCLGAQRKRGWAALQGGARPAGQLALHFLGVEGTGHHMLSFAGTGAFATMPERLAASQMKCLTGQRVLQSANVSVASVPSFPYRSRVTSRTSRGEYISRTDRTVRKQWPYDQPAGEGADALALQRRFADGNSLFVVMARDEASSIASNLARFYGRVARNTRNETAPYSERALELELTQQAMSYSNVEALARAVPCGRLMALPFELFLEDPCSAAVAVARFSGRLPEDSREERQWTEHVAALAASPFTRRDNRHKLLQFEVCRPLLALRPQLRAGKALQEALRGATREQVLACESAIKAEARRFYARMRWLWPLQVPQLPDEAGA